MAIKISDAAANLIRGLNAWLIKLKSDGEKTAQYQIAMETLDSIQAHSLYAMQIPFDADELCHPYYNALFHLESSAVHFGKYSAHAKFP